MDGGFAFCPVEGREHVFDVTYVTRVDLKGTLSHGELLVLHTLF